MKQFDLVVCGGTFDHFHKGHESFLKYVFAVGKRIIVGITSEEYIGKSKIKNQISKIEPFKERKKAVLEFAKTEGVLNKIEIVEIDDLFGPTLSKDFPIDAIVVSEDTKKGAEIINLKRKELGLKDLKILAAPLVKAQDGQIISSARIRNGEISRSGQLYINPLWFKKDLMLPEDLRKELQKPLGKLLVGTQDLSIDANHLIITVGDITTKTFNEKSLGQNISVIDFKVARKNKFSNILELGFSGDEKKFDVDNPAGYITSKLFKKITEIFKAGIKNKIILQISGEEDLAVLPLVLFSPLGSLIFYGQPNQGIVRVMVLEETKDKAYGLVDRFEMLK